MKHEPQPACLREHWLNALGLAAGAGSVMPNLHSGAVVEASAPKAYPRVALASASTLSGSVVRTLKGVEGLPKVFCLVVSNLGHLRSQCSIVCGFVL